ncbi:MAG: hypothetical protein GWN00_21500 [Aliifodinibius sp.]|nr:hypothetical protein [Fodinibius sp.]NIV13522.1 hypothetical protein [Fodinibius sp.]NIY27285.1 hypothetical protein [Fodinibius sp.]
MLVIRSFVTLFAVVSAAASVYLGTSEWAKSIHYGLSVSTWSLFLPVVVVSFYSIFGYHKGKRDPSTLTWYASQTYLLGYLCTITALVTLVFLLRLKPTDTGFTDPSTVVRAIGVALSTTLAGLIGMSILNHVRGPYEDRIPPEIAAQIREDTFDAFEGIRQLSDMCTKAKSSVGLLDEHFRTLCTAVEEFRSPIENGQAKIEELTESTTRLIKSLDKLSKFNLSPDVLEALEEGVVGVTRLDKASKTAEGSLGKLEESIKGLNTEVKGLQIPLKYGKEEMTEYVESVKQLKVVLDDFVDVTRKKITKI